MATFLGVLKRFNTDCVRLVWYLAADLPTCLWLYIHNNLYVIPATDCTSPAQPTSCIDSVQHRTEQWRSQQPAGSSSSLQLTNLNRVDGCPQFCIHHTD